LYFDPKFKLFRLIQKIPMKYSLLILLLYSSLAFSQKVPLLEDKTNGLKKVEGFINYYWDENSGKIYLELDKENLVDKEILYIASLPAGLGSNDIGLDRGLSGQGKVVKFSRVGKKVLLTESNYGYQALSPDPAEKRAVEQSFAQSTIWGFSLEAENANKLLIDATDFLLRDAMQVSSRIARLNQGRYTLNATRSAIYLPGSKNFKKNTELEASITWINEDGKVGEWVNSVVPSSEAISLRIHHSFVELPDRDYNPRVFDSRSSFIPVSFMDYGSPVSDPIRKYYVIRHRLKKKNPDSALSEPIQPIIYYLDNGTPEPIRSALLKGGNWWNQAFEAAGFKNAFQLKVLPEGADPMDIQYNMVNWVHRSTRGWSYGEAIVDPRTGEIIKGNVTLGSLRVRQDYLIAEGLLAPFTPNIQGKDRMLEMALDRLSQLAAHEIGHTLGLMHNYASSVNQRASVMDYPPPFVRLDNQGNIDLSRAYARGIGDWDKISINWGYRDFKTGTDEKKELNKIMSDASALGFQFISDRDARAAGGLHPQAHLWDNGVDAVSELEEVMKIRKKILSQFGEKNIPLETPMAFLEDVLVPAYLFHRYQLEAVTKIVGGMYYTYAQRGDGQVITRAISLKDQTRALDAAIDCIDPKVLALSPEIIRLIPPRPAGYDYHRELFNRRTGLAFDPLAAAETAADFPLSFLFNTERLNRMAQYKTLNEGLGVGEMVDRLISRTWNAPRETGFKQLIQLQNEQILLTYLLSTSVNHNASFITQSFIQKGIEDVKNLATQKLKTTRDPTYLAHLHLALDRIKYPEKANPGTEHEVMPPGAPIGMEDED
jgi:hypothetical protein